MTVIKVINGDINMSNIAILGHPTRGKEVITLLEMLGGTNDYFKLDGTIKSFYYYLFDNVIYQTAIPNDDKYFTLEEFLEKYPYKVGDKVCYQPNLQIDTICISEIISMKWADNSVIYFTSNGHSLHACDLQPYKEEIIEEGTNKAVFEGNAQSCDIMNDIIKEEAMEEKGTLEQIDLTRELRIADEVEVILGDYEFVLKDGKTYFVKKKPQYPKTYDECCKILGIEDRENGYCGYEYELLGEFQKLYICRDAYWEIAGEEMGLGKPWQPDWNNVSDKHCIYFVSGEIWLTECQTRQCTLAFPTAEMRDAFYENFKELIDKCKELL